MKKLINPYLDKEGYNCFGCSPTNPIGLHLEFWEDGEEVVTTWSPCLNYDGWVETLHGGIISTLIDLFATAAMNPDAAYSRLLLERVSKQYSVHSENVYERIMSVLDYITGMTDVYALDLFRKINGESIPII